MRRIQLWFYGIAAIVMFIASCIGCVRISYVSKENVTLTYTRLLGTQEITGLEITKDEEGLVKFKLATQKGTEGTVLNNLSEAAKNLSERLPKVP